MKKLPWIIFGLMLLFAILYVTRTVADLPPLRMSHTDGAMPRSMVKPAIDPGHVRPAARNFLCSSACPLAYARAVIFLEPRAIELRAPLASIVCFVRH